jgi:hypothetical protein
MLLPFWLIPATSPIFPLRVVIIYYLLYRVYKMLPPTRNRQPILAERLGNPTEELEDWCWEMVWG